MRKKRDEEALRVLELESESDAEATPEMDAAESRWDPWLRALARMEMASEVPVN